jgi:adenine-specific DNA-methyltransferase
MKLYATLESVLKSESHTKQLQLVDNQGDLMLNKIHDLVDKTDENFIGLLLENQELREKFFIKIKEVYVFKTNDFKFFLDENKIDNSYTQYENRIGLTAGGKFLKDSSDVVLDFPYKDCILEGGQSTEEGTDSYFEWDEKDNHYQEKQAKRKEIFFNTILAKDEIDRLLERKAFTNAKKYTQAPQPPKGEQETPFVKFERDANGTIKDNLIIKGNNLLALHSLKTEFAGKVKLIYIDPPYNTGNDSFAYNDNFNHSTWLTFMRNRLLVAYDLLKDDGLFFIQCDDNEHEYLKIIFNEIFGRRNFINHISVKTKSSAGFKIVNEGLMEISEYIYIYCKTKVKNVIKNTYIKGKYDLNYKFVILNPSDSIEKWNFSDINTELKSQLENLKETFGGKIPKSIEFDLKSAWALKNKEKVFRYTVINNDAGAETIEVKTKSLQNPDVVYIAKSGKGDLRYIYNGQQIFFYDKKVREINGELQPSELLSNIWTDIAWEGIAKEGNVTLNKGKKPEKLLQRIIEMTTNKNDIVMDYHLGSGTTAAVSHKMKRQYIGIEQLDYGQNDSVVRLQNVINNDQSGISKSVNWQGGGSFIYLELAKNNQNAIEHIQSCESYEDLMAFFDVMCTTYFLHYNVKVKEFREVICKEENFIKLTLDQQKVMFAKMLDVNQLYVNVSDMEDKKFGLNEMDILVTKDFYQI